MAGNSSQTQAKLNKRTPAGGAGVPLQPRLLSVADAARYVAVSDDTIRAWLDRGILKPVLMPACNGVILRRTLIDRAALDALVDSGQQK